MSEAEPKVSPEASVAVREAAPRAQAKGGRNRDLPAEGALGLEGVNRGYGVRGKGSGSLTRTRCWPGERMGVTGGAIDEVASASVRPITLADVPFGKAEDPSGGRRSSS